MQALPPAHPLKVALHLCVRGPVSLPGAIVTAPSLPGTSRLFFPQGDTHSNAFSLNSFRSQLFCGEPFGRNDVVCAYFRLGLLQSTNDVDTRALR